jgi:cytochrome c oxidase subunit II
VKFRVNLRSFTERTCGIRVAEFSSTLVPPPSSFAASAVLFLLAFTASGSTSTFRQEPAVAEPKTFEVIAKRFAFEPATIEVIEGDRVRLVVRSADGPHGVEIKQFKVKKAVPRAKPGDSPVVIEFVASAPGSFPILCSEYCGKGHEEMTGTLVVQAKPKEGVP